MEKNNEIRKTWLDLTKEELKNLTNVSSCMYGRQEDDDELRLK
ncbi:MAG: hypothetical protein NUV32_10560 [Exilispira sp.]|jgi:hypothetical protein|nr:hypothetical protein [Exilispira sp.]